MTDPVKPTRRVGPFRRIRGGRRTDDPPAAGATESVRAAAPVAPASADPSESPPVISAQIYGQAGAAENDPSAKTAQKARAAYLDVEWSGAANRRNRQGRIAKTEV